MYLRGTSGEVSEYASPSLSKNYSNLPPTITYVGDLEPFRDETIEYVDNLKAAGVPVKFELFKGAFHGFDLFAGKSSIGKRVLKFHHDAFVEYFDRYLG